MRLEEVRDDPLERVLDWTYPVWNEGLTREAYRRWNRGVMETAWGRGHLRRLALFDGGRPLATAKRYDIRARLSGQDADIAGIGAVFTPPELRGRGHASALIEAMVDDAGRRGCRAALLFSEIGAPFYERLGFRPIPQPILTIEIGNRSKGAPAVLVRSGDVRDLTEIAAISARAAAEAAFAIERSPDLIAFSIARKRLLAGLGPAGLRSVEFYVTEEGSRAVAYVILTRGPGGWVLHDCGDRDASGARVGAMLHVLAARTPAEQPARLRAWFPHAAAPPQARVVSIDQAAEIMMMRPIGAGAPAMPAGDKTVFPTIDYF
jgi:GNAT superfamily N-acetyltransferase